MPDFTLQVTGVTVGAWEDPASLDEPSRLNPFTGRSARRYLGVVGVAITLTAVVGGTVSPLDTALDGRLFAAASAHAPHPHPVSFYGATGQSSVQTFTPLAVGHYLVYLRRQGGGKVFAHIDVEAAP